MVDEDNIVNDIHKNIYRRTSTFGFHLLWSGGHRSSAVN